MGEREQKPQRQPGEQRQQEAPRLPVWPVVALPPARGVTLPISIRFLHLGFRPALELWISRTPGLNFYLCC